MINFKKVALVSRNNVSNPSFESVIKAAESVLKSNGCEAVTLALPPNDSEETRSILEAAVNDCDLIVIFGGDGTFLGIARKACHLNIPFVGINLGRLGFLTDIRETQLKESLECILRGEYTTEERELIRITIDNKVDSFALNDVVIHQRSISRMIELDVYVDDQYLTSYWADGVIFATPTGSTAYALSSGGPLVYPTLSAILIVPISPHTFSHRPIVLPADRKIKVKLKDSVKHAVSVSCDGQVVFDFNLGEELNLVSNASKITLIHPSNYSYFEILRAKLNWGHHPERER